MLTAERNRLGQAFRRGGKPDKDSLQAHVAYLERELRLSDTELARAIRESPAWREQADLLRSVPGSRARRLAHAPRAAAGTRPAHAQADREARRARPAPRDSGTLRGKRLIFGGRASVRAVLYVGALVATKRNPAIRAHYQRLLAAGKPQKLALPACMRKLLTILNAMVKAGTDWNEALSVAHA